MLIESTGDSQYLIINVFGESQHLNPFKINIKHIRYIREYKDDNGGKSHWAIFIGNKMFPTKDLGEHLKDMNTGKIIDIGQTKFECIVSSAISDEDKHYKCLINHENILYTRKYFTKKDDGTASATKISNNSVNAGKFDKFAVITIDERIVLQNKDVAKCKEHTSGPGSTRASS